MLDVRYERGIEYQVVSIKYQDIFILNAHD